MNITIIGLGYVGLPLAVEFSKHFPVTGYDVKKNRVIELNKGIDSTFAVETKNLKKVLTDKNRSIGLYLTNDSKYINESNIYIITVPTPIDSNNNPDLTPLEKASTLVGKIIKIGDIIIYESTVYPGVTEDICVPLIEKESGLKFNIDFSVGYSPERINPGDKEKTLTKIIKVTSGSNPEAAKIIDSLYNKIIDAGTHLAPSIKVAEAAKVIENSQRDINIAFINELSKIFNKLNIDTYSVLEAAGTKWNFLNFKPGLVGGHCIGVDPYYLALKAQEVGYHPEIILAGRRINDQMGKYVAEETVKLMIKKGLNIPKSKILILGITFKENCPDIRNSKVIDIYNELITYSCEVDFFDPWANPEEVTKEFNLKLINKINKKYESIILAVAHKQFLELKLKDYMVENGVIFDVKGVFKRDKVDGSL